MKRGFYILLIMCTAIMVVSCDKTKSYTDMLKAQEKAIDRLRADSGLVFLEEFPTDVRYWDKRRSVPVSSPGCLWKTVAWEPVLSTCSVLIQTVHIR